VASTGTSSRCNCSRLRWRRPRCNCARFPWRRPGFHPAVVVPGFGGIKNLAAGWNLEQVDVTASLDRALRWPYASSFSFGRGASVLGTKCASLAFCSRNASDHRKPRHISVAGMSLEDRMPRHISVAGTEDRLTSYLSMACISPMLVVPHGITAISPAPARTCRDSAVRQWRHKRGCNL
jgi:hypothetical protein